MFDDCLEIASPGGMFTGGLIQECDIYNMRSVRRNPVIADLFHRMKYMERRGSGLKKIVSETEMLPGYKPEFRPEFSSTTMDFKVTFKNLNYAPQVTPQVNVTKQILELCAEPRAKKEIAAACGFKDIKNFTQKYIVPLMESGQLNMTIPDKPNSKNQKYITVYNK